MIIIPQPYSVEREPTEAEKTDIESKKRYDDEPRREAFRAGARWERGEESDEPSFWCIVVGIFLLVNLVAFGGGALSDRPCETYGGVTRCSPNGKWKYVFPGYTAGAYFQEWMKQ